MSPTASERTGSAAFRDADSGATVTGVIKRRGLLVLLTILVAAGAAIALSQAQEKRYESTALLLFRPLGAEYQVLGLRYVPSTQDQSLQAQGDLVRVSSRDVAAATAARVGRSTDAVQSRVTVAPRGEGQLIAVTASGPDADGAAKLANDYAVTARNSLRLAEARRAHAARVALVRERRALSPSLRRGDQGAELTSEISQLEVLERIGSGSPQIVERARPASAPVAPKTRRNALLGALFGLLLGAAIALMREQSDRRLRHRAQLEGAFGLPVLGEIPRARALARRRPFAKLPPAVGEAFQVLQANVRYARNDDETRRVLVTSAASNEGKSTIAWNLAAAAAAAGRAVLLIEADLRHPDFVRRGLERSPGLSEVLEGTCELPEATQHVSVIPSVNSDHHERAMYVVVAGRAAMSPSELLQSWRLREVLEQAGREYELVVVDAPPLPAVADAVPLVRLADGVVAIAQIGRVTGDEAARLRDQLSNLNAPVLGVVANRVGRRDVSRTAYAART